MSLQANIRIDTSEVDRLLKGMTEAEKRQVLTASIKRAARPMRKRVRQRTPKGNTGNLRKSVGFERPKRPRRALQDIVFLTFRTKGKFAGYHASMIELGTKKRTTTKGANRGKVNGRQMMGKGVAETETVYLQRLQTEVFKDIKNKFAKL